MFLGTGFVQHANPIGINGDGGLRKMTETTVDGFKRISKELKLVSGVLGLTSNLALVAALLLIAEKLDDLSSLSKTMNR
jgi:hypothetical protein